jgi:urea transport system permease protein
MAALFIGVVMAFPNGLAGLYRKFMARAPPRRPAGMPGHQAGARQARLGEP